MGNAYMRFLAMFTLLGIILLAFYIMGGKPNPITPSIIIILSGLAVFSFIHLGMKAFTLFDPTTLATEVVLQLQRSLLNVVAGATYWDSPEFQEHERIKAESYIETLEVLAEIAQKERHLNGHELVDFCNKLIWFLQWNELEKSKIPRESNWFESKFNYPNWYQTNDTQTSLAAQSGTSLPPKKIKNHDWVEDRLLEIIFRSLKLNLEENRFALSHKLYDLLNRYIETCSYNGRIDYAMRVIRETSKISEDNIVRFLNRNKERQSLELIAICDYVATLPVTALLSFSRSIEAKNKNKNYFEIFKIFDWKLTKGIYHLGLCQKSVENLEWIQKRISFEIEVEKNRVTPEWYIKNLIFKSEAENFCKCVTALFEDAIDQYAKWTNKLSSTKRYWLAAACVTRENEFTFKLRKHSDIFEKYWTSIIKNKNHDDSWPNFKTDTLIKSLENRIDKIDIMSGEISYSLIQEERPDDYPDFAGQFLHSLSESVFKAIIENNNEKFLKLFPLCFATTFSQAQKLMPVDIKEKWQKENLTKVAFTPIIDLIDLSGYCIILSEYFKNPKISNIVKLFWSKYLKDNGNLNIPKIDMVLTMIASLDLSYEISHRNEYRFRWEKIVNRKLTQNVEKKSIAGENPFRNEFIRLHDSPLVRIFAQDELGLTHNGIDVFYTLILKSMLSKEQRKLIGIRRDLEDEMQREIELYTKHKNGEE